MIKIIALILTFLLTGCSSLLQQPPIQTPKTVCHYLAWSKRKAQLNNLTTWQASGNIAISSKNGSGHNASFNWQQTQGHYELRLFGPLGTQSILLSGNPQEVTLYAHNQVIKANNAETLLTQQLGVHLPVLQLYYWIRGLPAPQLRYTINLDAYNRLLQLRQSGWRVEYLHYTNLGKLDIPDKIVLSNPQWQIRILITHWDIN